MSLATVLPGTCGQVDDLEPSIHRESASGPGPFVCSSIRRSTTPRRVSGRSLGRRTSRWTCEPRDLRVPGNGDQGGSSRPRNDGTPVHDAARRARSTSAPANGARRVAPSELHLDVFAELAVHRPWMALLLLGIADVTWLFVGPLTSAPSCSILEPSSSGWFSRVLGFQIASIGVFARVFSYSKPFHTKARFIERRCRR